MGGCDLFNPVQNPPAPANPNLSIIPSQSKIDFRLSGRPWCRRAQGGVLLSAPRSSAGGTQKVDFHPLHWALPPKNITQLPPERKMPMGRGNQQEFGVPVGNRSCVGFLSWDSFQLCSLNFLPAQLQLCSLNFQHFQRRDFTPKSLSPP